MIGLPIGFVGDALVLEDGVAADPVSIRVEFDVTDRIALAAWKK